MTDLKKRGVQGDGLWITDGLKAMINAIALKFPASRRQRCVKYKMDNILSYIQFRRHTYLAALKCQQNLAACRRSIPGVRISKFNRQKPGKSQEKTLKLGDFDLLAVQKITFWTSPATC